MSIELLEKEFVSTLKDLINEMDLVFEYIPKTTIEKLSKYLVTLEEDKTFLNTEMKSFSETVKPFEQELYKIAFGQQKLKRTNFKFMENLALFNNNLNFSVFNNENKNTKKTIVTYLNTMYLSCAFTYLNIDDNTPLSQLSNELNQFISSVSNRNNEDEIEEIKPLNSSPKKNPSDIFGSLLSNQQLMSMADDISKTIQHENIDPMSLIGSIMSGKPNKKLNKLLNKVSKNIESKLESGELNKDELQEQANSIMNVINDSDLQNLPMLNSLLGKK